MAATRAVTWSPHAVYERSALTSSAWAASAALDLFVRICKQQAALLSGANAVNQGDTCMVKIHETNLKTIQPDAFPLRQSGSTGLGRFWD